MLSPQEIKLKKALDYLIGAFCVQPSKDRNVYMELAIEYIKEAQKYDTQISYGGPADLAAIGIASRFRRRR